MSPEVKNQSIESPSKIAEALKDRYDSEVLKPNTVHRIPELGPDGTPMDSCGNSSEGVDQKLRALIKAGDEFFGVVDVDLILRSDSGERPQFVNRTVLTRHIPGERAEIIGFIDNIGKPLVVGRQFQPGLSGKTSRDHFTIGTLSEGNVGVVDDKSSNGTEVFQLTEKSAYNESRHTDVDNPIDDFDFWSVKSSEIKDLIILAQ